MEDLVALIQKLLARLPELEWQLSKFNNQTIKEAISPELFNVRENATPIIATVYQDIENLKQHRQGLVSYYLAKKIEQKINILVRLCQMKTDENTHKRANNIKKFELDAISTYPQWLDKNQTHLLTLEAQKKSLTQRINQLSETSTAMSLSLADEIAIIEKNITYLKESLTSYGRF